MTFAQAQSNKRLRTANNVNCIFACQIDAAHAKVRLPLNVRAIAIFRMTAKPRYGDGPPTKTFIIPRFLPPGPQLVQQKRKLLPRDCLSGASKPSQSSRLGRTL